MVFSVNPSLTCPLPQKKSGKREHDYRRRFTDVSSPDFFWGRGDVCAQAKFNLSGNVIISCYARGKGTPSMMAYTGRLRPKSRRSTQQIFVRAGSAPRSNPLPVEKAFYICDWFLFYDSAGFQQLKQIQSYKQGMWKEYHLSIEGTQNCEKWNIKFVAYPPLPGYYVSMTLAPSHKCCFKDFEFSQIVRSSDLGCTL